MTDLVKQVTLSCAGMNISQARDVMELFDAAHEPFIFSYDDCDTFTQLAVRYPSERCSNVYVDFCGGPPGFENYYQTTTTILIADYILVAITRYDPDSLVELFSNLSIIGLHFDLPSLELLPF